MNTEYIKLFVRIAVFESISQAGKEFSLSPAVSGSYLNKLEEELGVKLVAGSVIKFKKPRKINLSCQTSECIIYDKR
ncbi:MAG: LysR family transcriptional regulator [Bdellovibrionota bacterium]|nr:LysR family transcriptional regulator [Bdellovibrionota bacterium]